MKQTAYVLVAAAISLLLVLSLPFTAVVSANNGGETSFQAVEETPSGDFPVVADPTQAETPDPQATPIPEETSILEQQTLPQESLAAAAASPTITVWGENGLYFGQNGNPQPLININGNVNDPDNDITGLTYRLDGGTAKNVPYNPANSSDRLVRPGDFTIEIPYSPLSTGWHTVQITATHSSGNSVSKTVQFHYTANQSPTLPHFVNWNMVEHINNAAQIVDGNWTFDTSAGYRGVRPVTGYTGYDRLIAVGNMNWSNYIVTVPVTVRSNGGSSPGGVGIIANWRGHTGSGSLPDDWHVMGAYGYYSWRNGGLAMWLNGSQNPSATDKSLFQLQNNVTYIFKLRAERISSSSGRYSLKVWRQGDPEPAWNAPQFQGVYNVPDTSGDQTSGSVLLVAHDVDAIFGNVSIVPLDWNPQHEVNIPLVRK